MLSAFTRERTELGLDPIAITTSNARDLVAHLSRSSRVADKLDRLIIHLQRKSKYAGNHVQVVAKDDYPTAHAENQLEMKFLIEQLGALGWTKNAYDPFTDSFSLVLTVEGWNRIAELERTQRKSNQAFVAMWFTRETERAYTEAIEKAISNCGFKAMRVDTLEHNEKICDRIIVEIRKSAFVVADFTGHRGGVYFEAGYALGLGIPVIWLCRKDNLEQAHFDTRQYNHIAWESETELCERLTDRIRATIIR